jgi:hypothetical protein
MAIESFGNGGLVITGEDIHKYRILAFRSAMFLELKRDQGPSGPSVFSQVKREFGLHGGRPSVYAQFCKMHSLEPIPERNKDTK